MEVMVDENKGFKNSEVGWIPEDWSIYKFDNITSLITCGMAATPKYVPINKGFPFLSSYNVKNGRIILDKYNCIGYDLHKNLNKNNPPQKGDILYSRVGSIGEAAVIETELEFSIYVSLTLIKPKSKYLNSHYLKHLLNSPKYKQRANDHVFIGGGVGNLNVSVVREYPIPIPTLKEQQAIAEALSDVDDLIRSLDAQIGKKQAIKKGTMQQLLTGKKRLDGFSGEWETKRLGEIAEIISGGTPSTKEPKNWDGNIPWCTPTDITSTISKYLSTTLRNISSSGLKNSSATILPKGTLLFCSRATIGEVKISNVEITTNQGFKSLICRKGFDNEFLYYLVVMTKEKFLEKAFGSTFLEISKSNMATIEFSFPDFEEQKAISEILSDMDSEIQALQQKRDKYKQIKQGMMQELLTGKTRLV